MSVGADGRRKSGPTVQPPIVNAPVVNAPVVNAIVIARRTVASSHDIVLRVPRNIACMCPRTTDCAERTRASLNGIPLQHAIGPPATEDFGLANDRHRVQQHLLMLRRTLDQAADDRAAGLAHMSHHLVLQGFDRGIRFDLHACEELLATFAIGHAVVEDQRDHDVEHLAEQADEATARGLTARQFGAYALRDRRDAGAYFLAELLDDGAIEAFLAAEVVLDGGEIDAGAFGDRACAGAFEAAGGEQIERGLQDAAAGLFAALVVAWPEAAHGGGHRRTPFEARALYRANAIVNRSI